MENFNTKASEVSMEETSPVNIVMDNVEAEPVAENTNEASPETEDEIETENYVTLGDKSCYIYFNLQFTGLMRNADLISIGLVDGDGRTFYAEFTDFDLQKCDGWVFTNVIKKLKKPETVLEGNDWTMTGTRTEIRTQLFFWLDRFASENKPVQFVGDVAHLSFTLLLDLIIGDPDVPFTVLPKWISPALLDLNQDLGNMLFRKKPVDVSKEDFDKNYIPNANAFQIDRVDCAKSLMDDTGDYHNALDQAKIIKALHLYIWNEKQ